MDVHVDGGGLRLDSGAWAPFWTALVHAVSNAVDHGIEPADERQAHGKPAAGNLWLVATEAADGVTVTVRDDGRGVDWNRVKEKAAGAGLPSASRADLVAALFAEGVTTAGAATVTSGRGVGMGVLLEATAALGGQIDVMSETGQGTTVRFRFPRGSAPGVARADAPAASRREA